MAPIINAHASMQDVYEVSKVPDILTSEQELRKVKVFETKVDAISAEFEKDIELNTIKDLLDFAGNKYTLIECQPSGYMIYHNTSAKFVEYSATSPSPYKDYTENLYYGGATEYYVLNNGVYFHTVIEDEYYPESEKTSFAEACNTADALFERSADKETIDYITTGKETQQIKLTSSTPTYITGATLINNLNTEPRMSYFPMNSCGYIAAAMLLLWHDVYINSAYIDTNNPHGEPYTTYLNGYRGFNGNPTNYYDGRTFSYNLWRWHSPFGQGDHVNGNYSTYALTIQLTMNTYLASKGISFTSQKHDIPLTFEIKNRLLTYDRPYILLGALKPTGNDSKSFHAVTVYGYSDDGLICHFGWKDFTCNYVSGIWGGGYMITG